MIIKIGEKEVKLDTDKLRFSEQTLSDYMETEAGWYDYFGSMLAEAEHLMQCYELAYDVLYAERYKEHKDKGCTDKLADASARSDDDVEQAKQEYIDAKFNVRLLQQHLRAWDRAHENAQSRGHFLRKEMDKLNKDIKETKTQDYNEEVDLLFRDLQGRNE